MIEILNTYDETNSDEKLNELHQLPKNVRQIGEVSGIKKIFIEDYVYTYLNQYANSDKENPQIAILLGKYYKHKNEKILLISASVKTNNYSNEKNEIELTNETWAYIYEKAKEFFEEYEILGWMFSHPGYSIGITENIEKIHVNNFIESNKALMIIDPVEKENAFYIYEQNRLKYQTGYYIYYERNERMHKYMLKNPIIIKKENPEPEEEVLINYKKHLQNRRQEVYHKRLINMLYVASGTLVVIVLVIGIALLNNYDKMRNLEVAMSNLTNDFMNKDNKQVQDINIQGGENNKVIEDINNTTMENNDKLNNQQEDKKNEEKQILQQNNFTIETETTQSNEYIHYIVEKGDTLVKIMFKFYNNTNKLKEIQEINKISNPDIIYIGQKLALPKQ